MSGPNNGAARRKHTEATVLAMREAYRAGDSYRSMVARFGIDKRALWEIIRGAHYGWVEGAITPHEWRSKRSQPLNG